MSTTTYSEQLKSAHKTVTITPSALIMEKVGDNFRGLYLGLQPFTKTDPNTGELKTLQVAHFFDGERVRFNMGAQLIRVVEKLPPGLSVEIRLAELSPNKKGGKTKIYDVTPLDIPLVKLEELFGGLLLITAPAPEHLLPPPPEAPSADGNLTNEELNAALYGL